MFSYTLRGRGVNLGAIKRFVLIALLLTAWVAPAAADDRETDFDALVRKVEKQSAPPPALPMPPPDGSNKASDPTAVDWFDLRQRNGVYFKKFSDVPFEGRLKPPNSGVFRRGLPEGEFLFDMGLARRSYLNGRPHGLWISYHHGRNVFMKLNYRNVKRHGPYIVFDTHGQLASKGNYKNGKPDGAWEFKIDLYGAHKGNKGRVVSGIYRNGKRVACLPVTPPKLCVIEP